LDDRLAADRGCDEEALEQLVAFLGRERGVEMVEFV
jgi:hypothetical protein